MKKWQTHRFLSIGFLTFATLFIFSCKKGSSGNGGNTGNPPPPPPVSYDWSFDPNVTWEDDFNSGTAPDPAKWGYDVGGNGWGNQELQYYTNAANASIANGILTITAKKESFGSNNYTSARMVTKNKADWLYGRIELKAKLPRGRGTWPAIWMLPTDNTYGIWPNSGEIDIMEHVGYEQNNVHFTLHMKDLNYMLGNQKTANKIISTASDDFHVYRVDWAPYGIRGYYDNEKIFEYMNPGAGFGTWPFDQKFHLLLNIAVGGTWGGAQGVDDTIFPASMDIDYIKVYKFLK